MAGRLGNVLYGVGCVLAALAFVPFAIVALALANEDAVGALLLMAIGLTVAAIPWAVGWACRYVLKGPTPSPASMKLADDDLGVGADRGSSHLTFHGFGQDKERFGRELTAVLLDPEARAELVRAAEKGRGEISAEQWAEITRDPDPADTATAIAARHRGLGEGRR